jgi:polysaccharide pyruvyl transferase WcaK-like protein
MLVHVFDTAIDSDNLGDHMIMEAVWGVLRPVFAEGVFVRTPTHRHASLAALLAARSHDISIVGGTNILKSHMLVRGNWRISLLDYAVWRNVVLLGVGWQQYGGDADWPTRLFFRSVLSKTALHSVRDLHTYGMLHQHVPTAIYTACPTMWELDDERCQRVPVRKARHAIFAVTYYRPAPEQDRRLYEILKRSYEKVFFWPQQARDMSYVRDIGIEGFIPIEPDVAAYDRLLDEEDVEFVGARLHGGIRALKRGRRALIVPVDNRATEISKSTALPVASRDEPATIERWIAHPRPTRIVLPWDAIERWKGQFASQRTSSLQREPVNSNETIGVGVG